MVNNHVIATYITEHEFVYGEKTVCMKTIGEFSSQNITIDNFGNITIETNSLSDPVMGSSINIQVNIDQLQLLLDKAKLIQKGVVDHVLV